MVATYNFGSVYLDKLQNMHNFVLNCVLYNIDLNFRHRNACIFKANNRYTYTLVISSFI